MEKSEILEMAREYVCPGKIDAFGQIGIDLVIGEREGPYIFDTDGKQIKITYINVCRFLIAWSLLSIISKCTWTIAACL